MIVEGKGMIVPAGITIALDAPRIRQLAGIAREREERNGYRYSGDQWLQGLADNATFRGLVGEDAFAVYMGIRLPGLRLKTDETARPKGDGGIDFRVGDCGVQLKCRRHRAHGILVRARHPSGRMASMLWDVLVQVTWGWRPGKSIRNFPVVLDGWLFKHEIISRELVPAVRGNHSNYQIPDCCLRPVDDLLEFFSGRTGQTIKRIHDVHSLPRKQGEDFQAHQKCLPGFQAW